MKESYITEEKSVDQADSLRKYFSGATSKVKDRTRVISFTSGKGGVGKTNVVVNLALALARQGNSVLILDADLGLANVDILVGLSPKYNLGHVLYEEKSIDDIILDGPGGISIIPAASGIEKICNLSSSDRLRLLDAVENISLSFDYMLVDTCAGISSDVMYFNSAAGEVMVVINPEPTSLTDAYALIKVLSSNYAAKQFSVISNNVRSASEGQSAFDQLQRVVDRFLQVQLKYLGHVPTDEMVPHSIRKQRALLELYPTSSAGLAFSTLARKIDEDYPLNRLNGGMQFFFRRILNQQSEIGQVR